MDVYKHMQWSMIVGADIYKHVHDIGWVRLCVYYQKRF